MTGNTLIYSVAAEHTTARYFYNALASDHGARVAYFDTPPDVAQLGPDDTFLFVDPATDWPIGLERARCRTVAYMIDVHQNLAGRLRMSHLFDAVFVAQKDYVAAFRDHGHPRAAWLPLACDPQVHHQPARARTIDVGFVGKLGTRGHRRREILNAVLPHYRTNELGTFHAPSEMARIYGQSKIVLNASINGDLNMRVFEAFAAGALLVTDRIENGLSGLFREGVHYAAYSSAKEAREKIDYYLAHDDERSRLAAAGCAEVLAHHTYAQRLGEMLTIAADARGLAPARRYPREALSKLHAQMFASMRRPDRIREVARHYGPSLALVLEWAKSWARRVNARVPLTPGAILARLRS